MLATVRYRRLMARWLAKEVRDEPGTLDTLMEGLICKSLTPISGGKILKMSAANGHTAEWMVDASFTPMDAADTLEDLISRKDEARAYLVAAGTAEPVDADICTEMLRCLVPQDGAGPVSNFRQLRNECVDVNDEL